MYSLERADFRKKVFSTKLLSLHHLVSHSFFELSTNFFLFEASKVAAAIGREKIKIFNYFQKEIKK